MTERTTKLDGKPVVLLGEALKVGEKAPSFTLRDPEMNEKTLADYGQQVKIISVVPSLDTGICDQQTRRFNEEVSTRPGVIVITVSVDLPFAQKRWCGAAGLSNAITLSDHLGATMAC